LGNLYYRELPLKKPSVGIEISRAFGLKLISNAAICVPEVSDLQRAESAAAEAVRGRAWCRPRAMEVRSRCKLSVEADGDTDRTMAQTSATHCPKGNEKLVFVVPIMPYGYRAAAPCRNADVMNITKFPITCETVLTVTSSSVLVL
jgi:hypothetical protein